MAAGVWPAFLSCDGFRGILVINYRRLPCVLCPACGKKVDAVSGVSRDAAPSSGDVSICLYCATPLFFAEDLTLRTMTEDEYNELEPDLQWDILRARKIVLYSKRVAGRFVG